MKPNPGSDNQHVTGFPAEGMLVFFEALWHTSDDPFWVAQPDGDDFVMVAANESALALEPGQVPGARFRAFLGSGEDARRIKAPYWDCVQNNRPIAVEQSAVVNGRRRYFEAILVPVQKPGASATLVWGTAKEVTRFVDADRELRALNNSLEQRILDRTEALKRANGELARLSVTDGLTGVYNRRYFDQTLRDSMTRRHNWPLSLVLIDVDFFKQFNDRHGHIAGDRCLEQVSTLLVETMPTEPAFAARYGGEEFALVLPRHDQYQAYTVSQRIRDALAAATWHCGEAITVSMGIATHTGSDANPSTSADTLISLADTRLYQAKNRGRDQVVFQ